MSQLGDEKYINLRISVLPEVFHLVSCCLVFALGVMVETHTTLRSVKVITNSETTDADGHFLEELKNTYIVSV